MPRVAPRNIAASLGFNGTTSRVSAAAISGLASAHSITGWVFPSRVQAGDHRVIANNVESSSSLETVTINTDLSIRAGYYNGTVYTRASSTPLVANQWSFFVYTWNGTSATLTINGVSQVGNTAPQSNTTAGLNIGARSDATTLINGALSEIRYFNRAISSDEAIALYTANVVPSGCVREYLLNEGSGTTAIDTVGAVNGTITSPVWSTTNVPLRARSAESGRVVPVKSRQPVGELLYNGDFEYAPPFTAAQTTALRWINGTATGSPVSGGLTTDRQYGWFVFDTNATGASIRFDDTVSFNGGSSLKLSLTDSSNRVIQVFNDASPFNVRSIPVLPGTAYTLTYRLKTNRTSGDGRGAFAAISERSAAGTNVLDTNGTFVKTTTDWTLYTVNVTTSATTRFVMIKLCNIATDSTANLVMDAWFDEISLTRTTPITRTLIT